MMKPEFLELVDLKRWQVIQDYFAEVIGASVRVVDTTGAPLTRLSHPHKCCFEVISSSAVAFETCKECLLFAPSPSSNDKLLTAQEFFLDSPSNIFYDACAFYLNRLVIPVRLPEKEVCAYIIIGPLMLGKRKTYPEYFYLGKNLDMDINRLMDGIEQVRVFSFRAIQSIVGLFQEVANYIVRIAREKTAVGAGGAMLGKEDIKKTMPFYANKMLQALFETATEGVNAERSSIMLYDHDSETLSIEMARGIPEHIVEKVKVRAGDGLAGWAAKENEVLFIDDEFNNRNLVGRLHQPDLKASLIVPIKSKDKVLGVLNLSTKNKEHKFTKESINSIVQLAKFVDTALESLQRDTAKTANRK